MSTRTRNDVILWGALGCALVATAHAEYTLATATHFNKYVALAVPGALDLYVVRALQQRRDVLVAVLAMVAANVTSHLIAGGVLQVGWQVIAAVGAVAPLIVWRVYSLKYTRVRPDLREVQGTSAGALKDEYAYSVMEYLARVRTSAVNALAPAPALAPEYAEYKAMAMEGLAPEYVPGEWAEEVHLTRDVPGTSAVPYLTPVPDLPAEYAAGAVHSDVLKASDWEFVDRAREYVRIAEGQECEPSIRGLRRHLNIGQERAERLLAHLGVAP